MAFSALVNTLVVALVALLPGASLSLTVIIVAAGGLSSTAGLIIVLLRDTRRRVRLDKLILPTILLALYGLQLATGIELGGSPGNLGHLPSLGGLCIGFFGFAIARAWTLLGARDSSLLATVVEMAGRLGGPDAISVHSGGPKKRAHHRPKKRSYRRARRTMSNPVTPRSGPSGGQDGGRAVALREPIACHRGPKLNF